ncbi:T9SS type A sorting domain-containing protein [bacterium SCSIO 12741]|nr:T9SS type A sorting domain-containing protein [bacterium SCSIO 12741]
MKKPLLYLTLLLTCPLVGFGQAQEPNLDHRPDLVQAVKASATGPLKTGFRENLGQLLNSDYKKDSTIAYYSESIYPRMWLGQKGRISWSSEVEKKSIDIYANGQIPDPSDSQINDTLLRIDLQAVDGNLNPVTSKPFAFDVTPDQAHFYLPHCGKEGIEHVPAYKKILWPDIYPGIHQQVNLVDANVSIHYVISPGADANNIRLLWEGYDRLSFSSKSLNAGFKSLNFGLTTLTAYEVDKWGRVVPLEWEANWVKHSDGTLGLLTGAYNSNNTLVIPLTATRSATRSQTNGGNLTYSTYLAGNGEDHLIELMTESNHSIYAAGFTSSHVFPNSSGKRIAYSGAYDCFAMQFDKDMKLQTSTFYGSTSFDQLEAATYHSKLGLYIGGVTYGYDLFKATNSKAGVLSSFVAHFDHDLRFVESVYYGGDNSTTLTDLVAHSKGVVATGFTITADSVYPLKFGQPTSWFQSDMAGSDDGFIAEFKSDLKLNYSSFFGGSGSDKIYRVKKDKDGNLYFLMTTQTQDYYSDCNHPTLPGELPLCSQLNNTTNYAPHGGDDYYLFVMTPQFELLWSTWLGGSSSEEFEKGADLVVDPNTVGDFYVALSTQNPTLFDLPDPAKTGYHWEPNNDRSQQMLLIRFEHFNPTWHTFAGCHDRTSSQGILELDDFGNVYLSGNTACKVPQAQYKWCQVPEGSEFPICDNHSNGTPLFIQRDADGNALNRGKTDAFIMAFNPRNELFWSTWFGGSENEGVTTLKFHAENQELYLGGVTDSPDKSIPLKKPGSSSSHFQDKLNGTMGAMLATYTPVIATYITEMDGKNQPIKAWPNPTENWIHLDFDQDYTSYSIYSTQGNVVKSGNLSAVNKALQVGELPVGQYVLELSGGDYPGRITFVRQ